MDHNVQRENLRPHMLRTSTFIIIFTYSGCLGCCDPPAPFPAPSSRPLARRSRPSVREPGQPSAPGLFRPLRGSHRRMTPTNDTWSDVFRRLAKAGGRIFPDVVGGFCASKFGSYGRTAKMFFLWFFSRLEARFNHVLKASQVETT